MLLSGGPLGLLYGSLELVDRLYLLFRYPLGVRNGVAGFGEVRLFARTFTRTLTSVLYSPMKFQVFFFCVFVRVRLRYLPYKSANCRVFSVIRRAIMKRKSRVSLSSYNRLSRNSTFPCHSYYLRNGERLFVSGY